MRRSQSGILAIRKGSRNNYNNARQLFELAKPLRQFVFLAAGIKPHRLSAAKLRCSWRNLEAIAVATAPWVSRLVTTSVEIQMADFGNTRQNQSSIAMGHSAFNPLKISLLSRQQSEVKIRPSPIASERSCLEQSRTFPCTRLFKQPGLLGQRSKSRGALSNPSNICSSTAKMLDTQKESQAKQQHGQKTDFW